MSDSETIVVAGVALVGTLVVLVGRVRTAAGDVAQDFGPLVPRVSGFLDSDSTVEQSTPASDTPDPTGPVDGPATQVEEPATPTSTVDEDVDHDPNVYASPDSEDLVSWDTAASAPTPDAGDSQTHGAISEAEDDDLSERAADSNLSESDMDAFDKFANQDL